MAHNAFFYGTLMASPVLHRVIWGSTTPPTAAHASLLRLRPAILPGHQRHRIKAKKYPAILAADAACSVSGVLVEGLTDGDLWRLDIFEGPEYARRKVQVRVVNTVGTDTPSTETLVGGGGAGQTRDDGVAAGRAQQQQAETSRLGDAGEVVEAEAYVWIDDEDKLDRNEWDLAEFMSEEMKWWVGREATGMREGFEGRASINEVDDAVAAKLRDGRQDSEMVRPTA